MKKIIFLAILLDLIAVILFTVIGRSSHNRDTSLLGFWITLWPFLAGAAIGWFLSRNWRAPMSIWPNGVVIWLSTIVFGMALRWLTGGGVAFTFVLVATAATGLFLIGWRFVAQLVIRARAKPQG